MDMYSKLIDCGIDVTQLKNKTFFITGATGLVGGIIAEQLLSMSEEHHLNCKLVLMIRSDRNLSRYLKDCVAAGRVILVYADVKVPVCYNGQVDYVIHAASITDSKTMVEHPTEVIDTCVFGTKNMLEFAKAKQVTSFAYLSTMEVYGFTENEILLGEDDLQYINPLVVRSSYPESKRLSEAYCAAYHAEYSLPVKIIRLAQTFGKGVKKTDNRAFAQFVRSALNGEDIVLATDGQSKRVYLDTEDAVSAILTVLLKGEDGQAYNAANASTYCSILDMAKLVADRIAQGRVQVRVNAALTEAGKYPPAHRLMLDTRKIEALGWSAERDLEQMYRCMIQCWENDC